MEYISTKEAAAKWGISTTRITVLANEGRIPGAQRVGKSWLIPIGADKPAERKPRRHATAEKADSFSFPLYPFRSDWSHAKAEQLKGQQKSLLAAEIAVLECRFADAYSLLEGILSAPEDVYTEVGSLWNAGICCISLNKPEEFSRYFLRLQMILAEDFPHRDDLVIVLDALKAYTETIGTAARTDVYNTDVHTQCLPLTCLQIGYTYLTKEAMQPDTAEAPLLELGLRFLKSTGSVIATEMMHYYLIGIYFLRHDAAMAEKHARIAVQMAYENKFYFPLVTFYRYFVPVLAPIVAEYPEEFQSHVDKLIKEYEKNFLAFLAVANESTIAFKLVDSDYPYIYAALTDQSNVAIAEKFGVSARVVKRKFASLCEKFGVANKKELRNFLRNYL